jgi:parvulin-like peptidyl-prolyl isomerase
MKEIRHPIRCAVLKHGAGPVALAALMALISATANAQTNQLRGINNGPATSNLPSAQQQIQRFQSQQQSTFSTRQQIDSMERRLNQQNLHQQNIDRAKDPCLSGVEKCR